MGIGNQVSVCRPEICLQVISTNGKILDIKKSLFIGVRTLPW